MARDLDSEAMAISPGHDSGQPACEWLMERVTRIELALSAWEAARVSSSLGSCPCVESVALSRMSARP